ncbi:hypothetical protein [Metabacillus fastidiosus]|uniref:hypothetical protein n=1 Tax=Metabacillus fastidiosus TaxID=1458 RepID=UPI003D2BCEAC
MGYLQEIDALQRWVFQTAQLQSHRLSHSPPKVTRPVILWEGPSRNKGENIGNYHFTKRTSQFGKLYTNNLDELAILLDKLEKNIGDRGEWLPIFSDETASAVQIGIMRKVQLETSTAATIDFPFSLRYEVIYKRKMPEPVPNATSVTNKIIIP